MQCPFCQKINRDSAKFCIHCGQAIVEAFDASQKSFDDFDSSDTTQSTGALFSDKAHSVAVNGGTIAQFTPQAETAMKNKKNQSHDLEKLLNRLDRNEDSSAGDDHASHHAEEVFIFPDEPQFEADFNIDYSEAPSPKRSILGSESKERDKKRDDSTPDTTVAGIESVDNFYIGEEAEEGDEEAVSLPSFLRDKEKRKRIAVIAIVSLFAFIVILALIFGGGKSEEKSRETTVAQDRPAQEATEEKNQAMTMPEEVPFELTRYEDLPKSSDFADLPGSDAEKMAQKNENAREKLAKDTKKSDTKADAAPEDKKLFAAKDNVFAGGEKGKELRLKRACVLREGPSSRFKPVAQLAEKSKVNVLTESDEDWELTQQGGRHAWKKGSEWRLGPGNQFFKAASGQGVPAASGRVISSKRWSYIKSGENYGWVGPVCFK